MSYMFAGASKIPSSAVRDAKRISTPSDVDDTALVRSEGGDVLTCPPELPR